MGEPQAKVSRHLSKLNDMGFVRDERRGKEIWYTAVPGRVRVEHVNGVLSLTVTAAGDSGVWVTFGMRLPRPEPATANPHPKGDRP